MIAFDVFQLYCLVNHKLSAYQTIFRLKWLTNRETSKRTKKKSTSYLLEFDSIPSKTDIWPKLLDGFRLPSDGNMDSGLLDSGFK